MVTPFQSWLDKTLMKVKVTTKKDRVDYHAHKTLGTTVFQTLIQPKIFRHNLA